MRNEFAAMSDMGYLRQPHTSAGRVPSDMGYRYYVDRLMSPRRIALSDAPQMTDREPTAVDDLVAGTCRLLSALTKLTALATSPTSSGVTLKWLDLHEVAVGRIIALAVWSNGQVRQTVIDMHGASHSLLDRVRRILSTALLESTADSVLQTSIEDLGLPPGLPTALANKVWEFVKHAARDVTAPELFVDGTKLSHSATGVSGDIGAGLRAFRSGRGDYDRQSVACCRCGGQSTGCHWRREPCGAASIVQSGSRLVWDCGRGTGQHRRVRTHADGLRQERRGCAVRRAEPLRCTCFAVAHLMAAQRSQIEASDRDGRTGLGP